MPIYSVGKVRTQLESTDELILQNVGWSEWIPLGLLDYYSIERLSNLKNDSTGIRFLCLDFFWNGGPFGIRIPYISIPLPHTTKKTYILIFVDWLKDVMKYETSMPWVLCAIGNVLTFCHIFLKETWLSSINI